MPPDAMCFLYPEFLVLFVFCCFLFSLLLFSIQFFKMLFQYWTYFPLFHFSRGGDLVCNFKRTLLCLLLTWWTGYFLFHHYSFIAFWTAYRVSSPKRPVNFIRIQSFKYREPNYFAD